jgi:hypothetical protein
MPRETPLRDPLDGSETAELNVLEPRTILPFAGGEPQPARRLVYFDPQTGAPRDEPVWKILPASTHPERKK